jgi:hypothetical protein
MAEDHIELTLERRRTGDTVEEAKKLWKECSEAALERWLELGDDVLYPLVLTTGAAHKLPSLVSPWALLFEGDKEELSKDMEPFGTIDGEKGSEDREHQSANPRRPSLTELTETEQLASASPENSPSLPRHQCKRCYEWRTKEEYSKRQWKLSGFCMDCSKS